MKASNTIPSISLQQWLGLGLSVAGLAYGIHGIQAPVFQSSDANKTIEIQSVSPAHTNITLESLEDIHRDLTESQVEAIFSNHLYGRAKHKAPALARHLMQLAGKYQISPSIILSVIQSESSFRFGAQSNVGAIGLMQVRPGTAKFIAKRMHLKSYRRAKDLLNPLINMDMGVAYLSYLRSRFSDSVHYVAAYNLGPTTVSNMLNTNTFALGKVTKYVSEIHAQSREMRTQNKQTVIAEQY